MTFTASDADSINPNVRCDRSGSILAGNLAKIKELLGQVGDQFGGQSLEDIINNLIAESGSESVGPWVRWESSFTTDSVSNGVIAVSDAAHFRFASRSGPANIGVTHDPHESDPPANGNFTVTRSGMYLFVVNFTAHYRLEGSPTEDDFSWVAFGNRYNRGEGWIAFPDNGSGDLSLIFKYPATALTNQVISNVGQCGSRTTLVPLLLGDKLLFHAYAEATFANARHTVRADVSFQRVGDYSEPVSIYP